MLELMEILIDYGPLNTPRRVETHALSSANHYNDISELDGYNRRQNGYLQSK